MCSSVSISIGWTMKKLFPCLFHDWKSLSSFVTNQQSESTLSILESLKENEEVELTWNHDYVTYKNENNHSKKVPERRIALVVRQ